MSKAFFQRKSLFETATQHDTTSCLRVLIRRVEQFQILICRRRAVSSRVANDATRKTRLAGVPGARVGSFAVVLCRCRGGSGISTGQRQRLQGVPNRSQRHAADPGTCKSLHCYRSGRLKDLVMVRFLPLLVFCSLFVASDQAAADPMRSTEFSSRQRCVCSTTYRPARSVHYKRLRVRTAYVIGYDPLPYRFGSTFVWEPPYRYYR